jgi:hypothetical protein
MKIDCGVSFDRFQVAREKNNGQEYEQQCFQTD